jgi:glycosyltransferase involved in cell wall biosynthesis
VRLIFTCPKWNRTLVYVFNWLNFVTCGVMESKLRQLIFFDALFADEHCDLMWVPAAGESIAFFSLPTVCTIHDLAYKDMKQNFSPLNVDFRSFNMSESVKKAKKIIAVSNFTKKRIMEEFPLPGSAIETIHIKMANRLDADVSEDDAHRILKRYNLIDRGYLIFTSCAWPNKNHDRLTEAFARSLKNANNEKMKNLKLVITGSETRSAALRAAEKFNIREKILGTDFMTKKDLKVLISHALAFIHPSLYEGFGIPITESMAAGVPIACSSAGSLPEIAGDAALYFDPYSVEEIEKAIEKIVSDEKLRDSLIKLGYKRAEIFADNESMIDDYIRVFEETMKACEKERTQRSAPNDENKPARKSD